MAEINPAGHDCGGPTPHGDYGEAIDSCHELDDGTFWVGNGEYSSQVNFCPYCGAAAPIPNRVRP